MCHLEAGWKLKRWVDIYIAWGHYYKRPQTCSCWDPNSCSGAKKYHQHFPRSSVSLPVEGMELEDTL